MKIKLRSKTKKILAIYFACLIILYVIIYVVPKVTDVFETTQTLEPGTLTISCDSKGYLVKDETVNVADATGVMAQSVVEGTVVKKGTTIVTIKDEGKEKGIGGKYQDYLDRLKSYDGLVEGGKAPISGVCSYSIDGYEEEFQIKNLENVTKAKADEVQENLLELNRQSAVKGEPVFKISRDDNWYVVCWLSKEEASEYFEGMDVTLKFPEGDVPARLQSITREHKMYKVVFYVNAYYSAFASTRFADITIVMSNNTGLIVDNECLIKKDKKLGVYVKDKDGDYAFKEVKVKASDGKQSALYDSTFTNDKYELVETVNVYDEVLRKPDVALKQEQKEEKEKETKEESK